MKIKKEGTKYYLQDTERNLGISNLGIIDSNGRPSVMDCTKYLRELEGIELGVYQNIIDKTFTFNGMSVMLHKDFLKFLKENQEQQLPPGLHQI